MAEEAVAVAERTDDLVDHGDACLALASVLGAAGDVAGARAAAEQAVALYERKGAAALVEKARGFGLPDTGDCRSAPEAPTVEPENECVRTLRRVEAAVNREAWSEVEQAHARIGSIESRRKIVGFERIDLPASKMASGAENFIRDMRVVRSRRPIVAIRGERLGAYPNGGRHCRRHSRGAAGRDAPACRPRRGGPDRAADLVRLDDIDAAMAELDAAYARFEVQFCTNSLENAASRADRQFNALFAEGALGRNRRTAGRRHQSR